MNPYHSCPRFENCGVNNCPLAFPVVYFSLPEDSEPKCRLPKRQRLKIAQQFNLGNKGLTPRELSASKKWAEMPEQERITKIQNLKQNSPISRLISKGYKIVRAKPTPTNFTLQNGEKSLIGTQQGRGLEGMEAGK